MGRPAQISRPAVLAAALEVADEHGLDAVTMQAVAARLGVTAMALYRHVRSKDDLLDGLVEALLTEFPPPDPGLPWRERLALTATAVRASAGRHPAVFPLLLRRPAETDQARRVRDGVLAALREAGLDDERAARAERLISTAVLGYAASEAAGRFGHHAREVRDADFEILLDVIGACVDPGGSRSCRE
ncbi:TetR/AcrR family transcriptional regulator [Nonomuraea sp. NPDC049486]|uniref:TetR/AcrR family transcriptional regulator n=1 Tax=Nonomuraea harbinensis TaxID=1286938 RepID=A0ABW1BNL3_9ACTN|nr:TetR/AcrR family transcriptional regulator [Nonomuraea harbinensis]